MTNRWRVVQLQYETGWAIVRKIFLPTVLAVAVRGLWQIWSISAWAWLFWFLVFVDEPFKWQRRSTLGRFASVPLYLGGGLNAIVTLANGGKMPVVGGTESNSVWVISDDSHRLLWLADRFWGASIGDILIVGGLFCMGLLAISTPIAEHIAQRRKSKAVTKVVLLG